jgi:hypothetical protein
MRKEREPGFRFRAAGTLAGYPALAFPLTLAFLTALAFLLALASSGCGGKGSEASRRTVDEALAELEKARPLLEDLAELNAKMNELGKRFTNQKDTVAEGMSLVDLINERIEELMVILRTAQGLFENVASSESGDLQRYAEMAGEAVGAQLEALETNQRLVRTLAEMLSLVEVAESEEQLLYYVDELERLAGELERQNDRAAQLAAEADAFHAEKKL